MHCRPTKRVGGLAGYDLQYAARTLVRCGRDPARFGFQFGPACAKDGIPMIQPNCRARFTAEDFAFVVRVLGRNPSQSISLVDLLTDPEVRDQILDHEALSRAVLENPGNLVISPQFYF